MAVYAQVSTFLKKKLIFSSIIFKILVNQLHSCGIFDGLFLRCLLYAFSRFLFLKKGESSRNAKLNLNIMKRNTCPLF